jgi:DNA-binding transcriptional ArsR family regulator
MTELARTFKALADATRLRVVNLLLRHPSCVCELEAALGLSQPLLSRHLSYLRNCGLVESRRDGMRVNYELNRKHKHLGQLHGFLVQALGDDAIGRADLARWSKRPLGAARAGMLLPRPRKRATHATRRAGRA